MSNDPRTRDYVTHQLANGGSKLDILSLLKRDDTLAANYRPWLTAT